jgi:hypothetical protein
MNMVTVMMRHAGLWSCTGRAHPQAGKTKGKKSTALLIQTPSRRVIILHLGKIDIPRHALGCITARSTIGGGVGDGGGPS